MLGPYILNLFEFMDLLPRFDLCFFLAFLEISDERVFGQGSWSLLSKVQLHGLKLILKQMKDTD